MASILAGLALGYVFVRRQRKLADPLIDLRLFRMPGFSASLAVYTLGILVLFGTFFFIFQYLQLVLGLSPLVAGLWTLPSFGAFVVGSMLAPMFVRRVRPSTVMTVGLAMGAVGFLVLTQVESGSGLAVIVVASIVYSLGLAPLFTLTNDLILGSAPPEQAGAASGISETGAELGGALSIAVLGTLGIAIYRSEIVDGIPAGLPAEDAGGRARFDRRCSRGGRRALRAALHAAARRRRGRVHPRAPDGRARERGRGGSRGGVHRRLHARAATGTRVRLRARSASRLQSPSASSSREMPANSSNRPRRSTDEFRSLRAS